MCPTSADGKHSLTGSVTYTTEGPAPPEGMCEPSAETYQAIAENSFVELWRLSPTPAELRFERIVAARRTTEDQTEVTDRFATILSKLNEAFGGGEGYVGSWFAEDDGPAFLAGRRIFGFEGVMGGGGEGGKSVFVVIGNFDDPRTMSGEWFFNESSQLLDCTSTGTGSGTWRAEFR